MRAVEHEMHTTWCPWHENQHRSACTCDVERVWRAENVDSASVPGHPADTVNHPPHYTSHPSGVECIQITEHMTFNLGSAVGYIWRAGLKGDIVEDLKKAKWHIEREISRVSPNARHDT